jgi:hypothetical protein
MHACNLEIGGRNLQRSIATFTEIVNALTVDIKPNNRRSRASEGDRNGKTYISKTNNRNFSCMIQKLPSRNELSACFYLPEPACSNEVLRADR